MDSSERQDPFLRGKGPWGPRQSARIILWPGAPESDQTLRMRIGTILGMDTATAGTLLMNGTPTRIAPTNDPALFEQSLLALRKLRMQVVRMGPAYLKVAIAHRVAVGLDASGTVLVDREGSPVALGGTVLAVQATLPAQGQKRDGSALEVLRAHGNFHDYAGEVDIVDLYHDGGLVRIRLNRFAWGEHSDMPDGVWRRARWMLPRIIASGGCMDDGYKKVVAVGRDVGPRVAIETSGVIPHREWDLTEYGCIAYAGLRQGVVSFAEIPER